MVSPATVSRETREPTGQLSRSATESPSLSYFGQPSNEPGAATYTGGVPPIGASIV